MKKFVLLAVFVIIALFSTTSYAYWKCGASSPYAFGIGVSLYQSTAAQIALHQCAARSPVGSVCVVDYCNWM
ncbi:MAG: hypothetical protein WC459_00835 [Patescibacteria group bacterium]